MLTINEAIEKRHSVRSYCDRKIEEDIRRQLDESIRIYNQQSGLHMRMVYDEPEGFNSALAHYGHFENVRNYLIIASAKDGDYLEKAGYYGEKVVLLAQQLGLNSCWVALTFNKRRVKKMLEKDEKLIIVVAMGYGNNDGHAHKNRDINALADLSAEDPQWYCDGIEAALKAPTAVNQQKFHFSREGNVVDLQTVGIGTNLKLDKGIVRCHFEIGAGPENFSWKQTL